MKAPPFPPPPTLYSRDVSLSLHSFPLLLSEAERVQRRDEEEEGDG